MVTGDRHILPSQTMHYLAVVTNVATKKEAQDLAQQIIAQNLAACAQIDEIESFYHWNGAIQHDQEFRILFKTIADHYPALEAAIKAHHPYELPPIHAIALDQVENAYGNWIAQNTRKKPDKSPD